MPANCADCAQMSGRPDKIKDKQVFLAGQCPPKNRHYNITGGSAGGGSSCGPGGVISTL